MRRVAVIVVLALGLSACGGSSSSHGGKTAISGQSSSAASAQVAAFNKETQGFRPAMEGYFQQHYCTGVSGAQCKCMRKQLDKLYVSARDYGNWLRRLIQGDANAKNDVLSVRGDCTAH